jgi:hypothetical protein
MTTSKLLSAALIAAAMIATPAMARQSHLPHRQLAERSYVSTVPGAGYYDYNYLGGRACYPAPRVGAFATQPWTNDVPCEPVAGY